MKTSRWRFLLEREFCTCPAPYTCNDVCSTCSKKYNRVVHRLLTSTLQSEEPELGVIELLSLAQENRKLKAQLETIRIAATPLFGPQWVLQSQVGGKCTFCGGTWRYNGKEFQAHCTSDCDKTKKENP